MSSLLRNPSRINQWLLWLGLAAAVAWLYLRHGEHLPNLLPFLLVLACPLLHLFGHGHGHGRHGQQGRPPEHPPAEHPETPSNGKA